MRIKIETKNKLENHFKDEIKKKKNNLTKGSTKKWNEGGPNC